MCRLSLYPFTHGGLFVDFFILHDGNFLNVLILYIFYWHTAAGR